MAVYYVRVKDTSHPVGLFVAPSIGWLIDFVDEACDPTACEYTRISCGYINLEPEGGVGAWPTDDQGPFDESMGREPPTLHVLNVDDGQGMWKALYEPDKCKWLPLFTGRE